jgi:hypothetical protein
MRKSNDVINPSQKCNSLCPLYLSPTVAVHFLKPVDDDDIGRST